MLFFIQEKYNFTKMINCTSQEDPFFIVKNYRKMVARRDRHHKKRKPKFYPPTNMKTRSMEQTQRNGTEDEFFGLDHYTEMIANSSQWQSSESPELLMLDENINGMEKSIDDHSMSLGEEQKPIQENSLFFFWNDEKNNEVNEAELLEIH